jgi:hypothetical protein
MVSRLGKRKSAYTCFAFSRASMAKPHQPPAPKGRVWPGILLGSQRTGSFLIPKIKELQNAFEAFSPPS